MNFKVLIRLLFLLTITISFRPNTAKPFSVLANVDKVSVTIMVMSETFRNEPLLRFTAVHYSIKIDVIP